MAASVPYARLPRRIQALFIDSVFLALSFFFIIFLIKFLRLHNQPMETFIILFLAFSIEPLFVSFTGGSVGHHISQIKIRKTSSDHNLNLFSSYIRFILKIPLGLFSLVSVLATKKHQAIHDIFSSSIVVLKSPNSMPVYERLAERQDDIQNYIYPSKLKRLSIILLYWVLNLAVFSVVSVKLVAEPSQGLQFPK